MSLNNKYIILPWKPVELGVFDFVVQTPESARTNLKGTKVLLKFPVHVQSEEDLPQRGRQYFKNVLTHDEVSDILKTSEWMKDPDFLNLE